MGERHQTGIVDRIDEYAGGDTDRLLRVVVFDLAAIR